MKRQRKTLFIVRHAHRDKRKIEIDNGLSERGLTERSELEPKVERAIRKARAGSPASARLDFFTSPKARCRETIEGLARAFGGRLRSIDDLDEGKSRADLERKIAAVTARFIASPPGSVTVVCTHGDWIEAFERASGRRGRAIGLKKGAWTSVVWELGRAGQGSPR